MAYTRVKICGITRAEDAVRAAELGADAVGLNFVGGPRRITYAKAAEIVDDLAPCVTVVGLVTAPSRDNPDPPSVRELMGFDQRDYSLAIRVFQMYGSGILEINECLKLDNRSMFHYWPVFHVSKRDFVGEMRLLMPENDQALYRTRPQAILLDTGGTGQLGGTGTSFNWTWIAEARAAGELVEVPPIILAGGLTPENVAEAIRIARPYAVDVSSGVEVAGKPGVKDPIKMRDFIQAAKGAGNDER